MSAPTSEELIWRMVKTFYVAVPFAGAGKWESVPQPLKEALYDAMWHALHELRVPSDEMLDASWTRTSRATAQVRMMMELGHPREAHKMKMAHRFGAMIDKLLEVRNGDQEKGSDPGAGGRPR